MPNTRTSDPPLKSEIVSDARYYGNYSWPTPDGDVCVSMLKVGEVRNKVYRLPDEDGKLCWTFTAEDDRPPIYSYGSPEGR